MGSAKNNLIDALERLVSEQKVEARWKAAVSLSNDLGLESILVASLDQQSKNIKWVNTTMSGSWMEEYLSRNYIAVDPHIPRLAGGQKISRLDIGKLHRDDAPAAKAWDLDNGLRNEGFARMICSRYGGNDIGINVTLGFGHEVGERDLGFDHRLFAALLASTIGDPVEGVSNRILGATPQKPPLTRRQTEVLTLLAQGLQTARIAEKLGLSESAVSLHFANARQALGAQTREHALAIALRDGWLTF